MMFPVLGKMSQGLEAASGMEEQSAATSMLQTLANGTADSAAFGLVMLSAFQIIMICYLLCMGPIAAAFYAWPSGMGSLFNRIFSAWLDSIINIGFVEVLVDHSSSLYNGPAELDRKSGRMG